MNLIFQMLPWHMKKNPHCIRPLNSNFYVDKNYTKLWESDLSSSIFNVSRENKSGLSTTSKVSVSIGKTTPSILYYRLDPVTNNNLPKIKSEVMVDDEIIGRVALKLEIVFTMDLGEYQSLELISLSSHQ